MIFTATLMRFFQRPWNTSAKNPLPSCSSRQNSSLGSSHTSTVDLERSAGRGSLWGGGGGGRDGDEEEEEEEAEEEEEEEEEEEGEEEEEEGEGEGERTRKAPAWLSGAPRLLSASSRLILPKNQLGPRGDTEQRVGPRDRDDPGAQKAQARSWSTGFLTVPPVPDPAGGTGEQEYMAL
ncbi:hypothetical protein CRUP_030848 [Coryphaenoides rupestris]|nr:hypothetical protein CRUP_030848 [Coryphaenoides rupestris]